MSTVSTLPPAPTVDSPPVERPHRRPKASSNDVLEVASSAVSSLAFVWVVFSVAGLDAPFGLLLCSFLTFLLVYGTLSRVRHGALVMKNRLGTIFVWSGGLVAMVPLFLIIGWLLVRGAPVVFSHFPHYITHDAATAGAEQPTWTAGVGAAIVGTVEQVGLATLVACPIAVLTATFLNESRSGYSKVVRLVVDAMTGTPEIIAGLFVYLLWVQPHHTSGKSGAAAAAALAVMMLPFVTRGAQEVLRTVPGSLREAGMALGAPHWRLTLRVMLPTARVGLVTVAILGVARAVGETAAVLFNAGGSANAHFNWNPFHGNQLDLPLYVLQLAQSAPANQVKEAWGGALVLVFFVLGLFALTRILGSGMPRGPRFSRFLLPPWRRLSADSQ
ncbi:MAG TPA: phosphate ABC transporter permease PstA [Acidimicrobiales bacterium]|nr:phosphate ABC transporter permease PstA [Acidimicrobiales bacterium]